MPDEAIRIIANGETTAQRLNTFRLLAGDFSTLDDAAAGSKTIIRDELGGLIVQGMLLNQEPELGTNCLLHVEEVRRLFRLRYVFSI